MSLGLGGAKHANDNSDIIPYYMTGELFFIFYYFIRRGLFLLLQYFYYCNINTTILWIDLYMAYERSCNYSVTMEL